MKIGIVTQPIVNNYGGVLQTYALQSVLKKIGYKPILIDYIPKSQSIIRYIASCAKTFFFFFSSKKRRPFSKRVVNKRFCKFEIFLDTYIEKTPVVWDYSSDLLKYSNYDAIIVGSDQVWRPKYNNQLANMYLDFTKDFHIKRISYAASFGVDKWEYTTYQTRKCSCLAKRFNAVSVREESGVKLCKDYLDINATWVLDPTLLLKKEDYCGICSKIPVSTEKFLIAYVLDVNVFIREYCECIAKERHLTIKYFSAGANATISIPEWLAMFRDTSYVVTDSFHGTVFSIIFRKEFKCIYNKDRGAARFESLLNLYNSGKIEKMRDFSISWLKNALED